MARPSKKRRHVLCIRLTDEELRVLRLNAETAAVDLSTIARAQILGGPIPRRARRVSLDRQMLGEAMHAMGKLGTNLNQLTKVANATGSLSHIRELRSTQGVLEVIRDLVRGALSP